MLDDFSAQGKRIRFIVLSCCTSLLVLHFAYNNIKDNVITNEGIFCNVSFLSLTLKRKTCFDSTKGDPN